MMLSLYATLGVITFAAWSSFAHAAVMAVMAVHLKNERADLLGAGTVFTVIGTILILLAPGKPSARLALTANAQVRARASSGL
jgi:hypothetical protein